VPDLVRIEDTFSIVADADRTTAPRRVLKQGESFAVFDQYGDILPEDAGEQGLYHDGTRFLSHLELLLFGKRPLLLSSTVSDDNVVFTADLSNPDVRRGELIVMPRGELHLFRSRLLWNGSCLERIRISNYALQPIEAPIAIRYDADFADVFEVRGTRRALKGNRLPGQCAAECVLPYEGRDGLERRTRVRFSPRPSVCEAGLATFMVRLEPRDTMDLEVTISCETADQRREAPSFGDALVTARDVPASRATAGAHVRGASEGLNRWIRRSTADLQMMLTDTEHGVYPYAGIPWFSTPFGRDGIITALEMLWADPTIARGVLSFLAATQARDYSDAQDAQPGKILHEMRRGEMAALGEVPFGRYYGTADATPLFVALAHAYYERTADVAFVDALWPHIVAALEWMRKDGDPDGDGFIEYWRRSDTGLIQQGWKDSHDSIFHADGTLAEPPIALCEVQGYAYAAWSGAARLAELRGDVRAAAQWLERAEQLRARFEQAFWCDELDTYALALDGQKRPCRVRTTNPGHCLFTGIASRERARRVAGTLMAEPSFSGWGVRTVAAAEARYNPMSYHDGSIWPHDNAIIAAGLARYGLAAPATRILNAMFDLSQAVDLNRLPELICGFHRRGGDFPTLYPVACAPQAWSAGAVYLLIQACLGLHVDAPGRQLLFRRTSLPESIEWLRIMNIRIGDAVVDLFVERHPHDVGVTVLRREGEIEIIAVK
jgi:glycogen debranching enzyme